MLTYDSLLSRYQLNNLSMCQRCQQSSILRRGIKNLWPMAMASMSFLRNSKNNEKTLRKSSFHDDLDNEQTAKKYIYTWSMEGVWFTDSRYYYAG
ncbi:hypothetical protein M378DRAFT_796832 [Amanita muscaria Koide BX008]|uniref:Uncharacterized protein n=1 Tax=Amanita muscaria (strain Koide BX008) TaxID=946122 RepID=A0A0C2WD29_AMAMK|nr:hypothetical protein M378DRAFT_796832 [Amanita muscaria Koide BX008]